MEFTRSVKWFLYCCLKNFKLLGASSWSFLAVKSLCFDYQDSSEFRYFYILMLQEELNRKKQKQKDSLEAMKNHRIQMVTAYFYSSTPFFIPRPCGKFWILRSWLWHFLTRRLASSYHIEGYFQHSISYCVFIFPDDNTITYWVLEVSLNVVTTCSTQ